LQPVKFVTADSLDSDTGFVRLRVGTDLGGSGGPGGTSKPVISKNIKEENIDVRKANKLDTLRAGYKNMISEKVSKKFAEKDEVDDEPPIGAPIIAACYNGDYLYEENYWEGDVNYKMGDSLHYFEIKIIPDTLALKDTLAFGETAKLIVQAKDADSNDVEFPDDKLLTFRIESNENYGTFINANGDTLRATPVVLKNVNYGSAKDGSIRFAAVKENPDSFVTCSIRVSLQEDTTKAGERKAIVLEQTLSIDIVEPYSVYPTYFNSHGVRVYIEQLSQKQFDVKMTRGGKSVSRHHFKLYTDYVVGSGGHNHINIRANNNDNYGYFLKPNDNQHYRPLEDSTSNLGRLDNIIYNASYFGDLMRIYLESSQNKLFIDSIDIIERIPNLVELQEGNNYELVGAPQNHSGTNDPCRPTAPTSQHSVNHFGTQQMITSIQNIADDYALLHSGIIIRVNDMSLENGGLFDANNNWSNPHQSHRMGTNADIGFTGISQNDNCVNLNRRDLENIIRRHTSQAPYIEGDHYHVYQ